MPWNAANSRRARHRCRRLAFCKSMDDARLHIPNVVLNLRLTLVAKLMDQFVKWWGFADLIPMLSIPTPSHDHEVYRGQHGDGRGN